MTKKSIAVAASLVACAFTAVRPALAQSLGDVAKKEEERRKTAPKADRIITNDNLTRDALESSIDLTKIPEPDRARVGAAGAFLGYYFSNTRMLVDFCREHWNVDTTPVVAAYSTRYRAEFVKAQTVFRHAGLSEEAFWSKMQPRARAVVESRTATSKDTMESGCVAARANPDAFAREMNFSTEFPTEYRLLMAASPRQ
jgi:hypothetical protein